MDYAEARVNFTKLVMSIALLYLLYVNITCPCRPELYKCHLTPIYLAILVVLLCVISYNGMRVKTYH